MNSLDAAFVPIAAPADQLAMPLLTSRNYRCQCGQPVYFRNSACLTCGTALGYDVPAGLAELGMESEFRSAIDAAAAAHALIERDAGSAIAQYVVPLAFRLRWYFRVNLREIYHLCELRTTPQGHPDYRWVAQEMFRLVAEVHPRLTRYAKFVDMGPGDELERRQSERRIDEKLGALDSPKRVQT